MRSLFVMPLYKLKSLCSIITSEQLNNKTEALSAYNKLVAAYPNSPEAAKAQEKITQLK